MASNVSKILRTIASSLNIPVMIILILLIGLSLFLLGSLAAEFFTERRLLSVKLPQMLDDLKAPGADVRGCIRDSGLLRRQKIALLEVLDHPNLTQTMREAMAVRLLEEEKSRYDRIVKVSDVIAKLAPMFGLLGTLIPLGPGIVALGQKDVFTLSQSLLIAFDTTIAGLVSAAVVTVISAVRKSWYADYMSILESLMECVLEVTKDEAQA